MEEAIYNILWIDDEHEALASTKGRAKRHGINLIPYKSLNSGMDELEKNYPHYDGVLLDAKFLETDDDLTGTEDTRNAIRANYMLASLPKKFEVFVLTGQAETFADKTFQQVFTKIFKKGSDTEMDRLFSEIKVAAGNQQDTQIRHKYRRVFDVCTERYIGEMASQDLLAILKSIENDEIDDHFNKMRKIVEDLFQAFNKFNLLPSDFVKPIIALNESSKFLAGKDSKGILYGEKGFQHGEDTHLPKQIANNLHNILMVSQPGSHRSEVDLHVKKLKTPYLMKSVFYQLLDVIIWFKMHVDSKPKTENWLKLQSNDKSEMVFSDLLPGIVIEKNKDKGYAFFKPNEGDGNVFIPPHLVTEHKLNEGVSIQVEIEEYLENRSGEIKKRVKRLETIG